MQENLKIIQNGGYLIIRRIRMDVLKTLILLMVGFLFSCAAPDVRPDYLPRERNSLDNLQRATVAFVKRLEGSDKYFSYCSGVFVSRMEVLTAAHCVIDEPVDQIFIVPFSEIEGLYAISYDKAWQFAVSDIAPEKDLALLTPYDEFNFSIVPRTHVDVSSRDEIYIGEQIFLSSHPGGQGWALTRGIVSRKVYADDVEINDYQTLSGWLMQSGLNAFPGSSGGPIIDSGGNLVGIVSLGTVRGGILSRNYVQGSFFAVHLLEIQDFLGN